MKLSAQSCTRVDFAGGTLDLWPLYRLIPKSQTVNASINCYTFADFTPGDELKINVVSADFNESFSFESYEDFMSSKDSKLSLLQVASTILEEKKSFLGEWVVKSESPAGSGLGGSSSILITLLKVIAKIRNEESYSEEKLISIARDLESTVLKTPAGIQDYFSPIKKGINVIKYAASGFKRESLNEVAKFWQERVLIIDSQIKHHSGFNNWQILKEFVEGDDKVVAAMKNISDVAIKTEAALRNKDMLELSSCFKSELEARKKVSKEYISKDLSSFIEKLDSIKEVFSYKVCGAGGGGCLILLFNPLDKENLLQALSLKNIAVLPFELEV